MSDRTELFVSWVEDADVVTASEVLHFADYVKMTVAEVIARLRRANIDVVPDGGPQM